MVAQGNNMTNKEIAKVLYKLGYRAVAQDKVGNFCEYFKHYNPKVTQVILVSNGSVVGYINNDLITDEQTILDIQIAYNRLQKDILKLK